MNPLAVITGASSGIGYELAKLLAADGHDLVLVARRREKLKKIQENLEKKFKIHVTIIIKDLSEPEAAQDLFDRLKKKRIDIFINNAGFGNYGFFVETDWKIDDQMLALNVVTLTHLSKLFAKKMVQEQSGKIMNVASTAAFQPGPLMAVYFASKAYVLSFTEALSNELNGTGVSVTALCPPPTASGFQDAAHMNLSPVVSNRKGLATAEEVAEYGYSSLKSGKVVAVYGFKNRFMIFLQRFIPRGITLLILRKLLGGSK